MGVVVHIGGRQAIPVRAIPLLTDWGVLSPDVCAEVFAGVEGTTPHLEGLATYRLDEAGNPQPIAARWWANWTVQELGACSAHITAAQTSHVVGFSQWRSESLTLLPAGVFVWRDEFELAFQREYSPISLRARFAGEEYDEAAYQLNFNPQHGPREDWQTLVTEGFEFARMSNAEATQGEEADFIIGFYSRTLDIEQWARHPAVAPAQAARLLCGCDPLSEDASDRNAQILTHLFESWSTCHPGPRTLAQWAHIAREQDARHSAGIGRAVEYLAGQTGSAPSEAPAPKPAHQTPQQRKEARQAQRWQECIDAGLTMPTDTYAAYPPGINVVAERLGIRRQSLAEDLDAYRERFFSRQQ